MKRAFVFPGQGSQKVGMAKDLYEEFPMAKQIMEEADSYLGFKLTDIMFNGPEDKLKESKNTQPAILLHSYVVFKLVKDKMDFHMAAGHSLGEYSALLATGAISFSDALHVVRFRGELMSKAGEENPGTMAAIIGLPLETVQEIVDSVKDKGIILIANHNEPGQFVVSGEVEPVRLAAKLAKEKGGRGIPLRVSGAFHSPLMESAVEPFGKVLSKIDFKQPEKPVYCNVTASPVKQPDEIRKLLTDQIMSPVRWIESIQNMIKDGATEFVELGPGNVLTKLIQKISRDVKVWNLSTAEDIRRFLDA